MVLDGEGGLIGDGDFWLLVLEATDSSAGARSSPLLGASLEDFVRSLPRSAFSPRPFFPPVLAGLSDRFRFTAELFNCERARSLIFATPFLTASLSLRRATLLVNRNSFSLVTMSLHSAEFDLSFFFVEACHPMMENFYPGQAQ